MEATITRRVQLPSQEPEEIDYRSLPQTTVRKVIKKCLEDGNFDTTPYINPKTPNPLFLSMFRLILL